MSQTKAYQAVALGMAASLLMAVSCTIESSSPDDDGGEGGTSSSGGASTKTGGTTGKGGATTGNTSAGSGGTKSSSVGGAGGITSTAAAAGTSALSSAGSTQVATSGGSAGSTTLGAGGSAGTTSTQIAAAGAAGGPTCIDADSQVQTPTPCAELAEKCEDGTTDSPARATCFDVWGAYKAPVALAIQQCLARFPSGFDACDTGSQIAIDACVSASVANTCTSTTASISCTAWASTCSTLDKVACEARLSSTLNPTTFIACYTISSISDCNQRLRSCE